MSTLRGAQNRVMVVTDDAPTGESLRAVLSGEGFEVLAASDLAQAMSLGDERPPEAVIVDSPSGGPAGATMARRIKEHYPDASVLLLTSAATVDDVVLHTPELDGLLVKPLLPQSFLQTVRDALSIRALSAENRRLSADFARIAGREAMESRSVEPPDRSFFVNRVSSALAQSQSERSPMAVAVVEIDGWQEMVSRLGVAGSEGAMASLASRLVAGRRRTDLVGRVAVDRFGVVCTNIRTPADCHRVVKIILDSLERPITVEGEEQWLVPRAGAVITDPSSPGQTADMLLNDAEMALSCARDEGRPWRLFEKAMLDQVFAREGVGLAIREAMDANQLKLVYHPLIELQSARVVGASLHLRWMRADGPVLLSSEFLAEEGDAALSAQVNAWMTDRAFAELAAWVQARQLQEDFRLSVSVSSRDVGNPQFAETMEELMAKHAVPGSMLDLDLTGPAAMEAVSSGSALEYLGRLGVRLTLDDFGGSEVKPSSLVALPIKLLKIDASLIEALDAQDGARASALVRGLVALGHELRMNTVAKGLRTSSQRTALLAMGCELGQYSLFGRPGAPGQPWVPEAGEPQPLEPLTRR